MAGQRAEGGGLLSKELREMLQATQRRKVTEATDLEKKAVARSKWGRTHFVSLRSAAVHRTS